jgi:nucleoside-diphosphate-sugar epimerase
LLYVSDAIDGMLLSLPKGIGSAFNLGSGNGHSIRELCRCCAPGHRATRIRVWDASKPSGEPRKVADIVVPGTCWASCPKSR